MPVNLDDYDPDIDLTPGTTRSDAVVFLYQRPNLGWRPAEVRDALDIPRGTATTTLGRLYEDGYVGKTDDGYYYALDHREELRRYVASLDQLHRMFDDEVDLKRREFIASREHLNTLNDFVEPDAPTATASTPAAKSEELWANSLYNADEGVSEAATTEEPAAESADRASDTEEETEAALERELDELEAEIAADIAAETEAEGQK
jgi:DNA-binding MarR family transcriptional regulator